MKNSTKVLGLAFAASGMFLGAMTVSADEVKGYTMYRLYNANSGEHFYTKDAKEKKELVTAGWKNEGTGWYAPAKGTPVYRLYNKNAGDHHYTLSQAEKTSLVNVGWTYEGIGWYSEADTGTKLYRAYNPNAKAGSHNYTLSSIEQVSLIRAGWKDEGIAWYGMEAGKTVFTGVDDVTVDQSTGEFDASKGVKATDFLGNDAGFTVTGSVDMKKPGKYTLTYTAMDGQEKKTIANRIVTVKKVADPVISGVKDMTIKKSSNNYDYDKGVTAKDAAGKDLPVEVTTTLTKNNPKSGVYTVMYTATDVFGNKTTKAQSVTIVNDLKPTFTGIEDKQVSIAAGSFDPKAGVTATDGDGNNLTFTVSGTVDFSKPGLNVLTYSVTDASKNTATATRTIQVNASYLVSFTIDGKNDMTVGDTQTLTVKANPTDSFVDITAYESSDKEVATVDANGKVTAVKAGKTTITAKDQSGKTATFAITVAAKK